MNKIHNASILILGLNGTGIEIAKNLTLGGIGKITIYDPRLVKEEDLGLNYYLSMNNIGQPTDKSSIKSLANLNEMVTLNVLEGPSLYESFPIPDLQHIEYSQYNLVVAVNIPIYILIDLDRELRSKGISVIAVSNNGLIGSVFCRFLPPPQYSNDSHYEPKSAEFVVLEPNHQEPPRGLIESITIDNDGLVICAEEKPHRLSNGAQIIFKNTTKYPQLNNLGPFDVRVNNSYSFFIGDTTHFPLNITGIDFVEIEKPIKLLFKSLEETLLSPQISNTDPTISNKLYNIHLSYMALSDSHKENGIYPSIDNASLELLYEIIESYIPIFSNEVTLDRDLLNKILPRYTYESPVISAIIGGIAAQEVFKAVSNRFVPIHQYLYVDLTETLPINMSHMNSVTSIDRYSNLRSIYGSEFVEALHKTSIILCGSGAIGCELLKIWSTMGLGISTKLYVIDMDSIERSNLNRQLLFREKDIGSLKSEVAVAKLCKMNSDYTAHVIPMTEKIGPDTENIITRQLFMETDIVVNALDNLQTRLYVDQRCVSELTPLLDAGTMGAQCNTQVVIPYITEAYGTSQDPPETTIPFCTLKNFPNQIEHTIQWAMDLFEGLFSRAPEMANKFLESPSEFTGSMEQNPLEQSTYEFIYRYLDPKSFQSISDCVKAARSIYEEHFCNNIKQLLYNFPADYISKNNVLFWSGSKKCPTPIEFTLDNLDCLNFIIHTSNLLRKVVGISHHITNQKEIEEILKGFQPVKFVPKENLKIHVSDEEANANMNTKPGPESVDLEKLAKHADLNKRLTPIEFEKDNDENGHIGFINATANIRARSYQIEPTNFHNTRKIAGKIVPAIATTTAYIAGCLTAELLKLVEDYHGGKSPNSNGHIRKIEQYKNTYSDLSKPFFIYAEPFPPPKYKYKDNVWTLWDRIIFDGSKSLLELFDYLLKTYEVDIVMVTYQNFALYGLIQNKAEIQKRNKMELWELCESVSGETISKTNRIALTVLAETSDGVDVDLPLIYLY